MYKFVMHKKDGRYLIGLGLSHGNLDAIKAGRPIEFPIAELGVEVEGNPDSSVVIAYKTPELEELVKGQRLRRNINFFLMFDDKSIEHFREGKVRIVKIPDSSVEFVILGGKTEADIHALFRDKGMIGPETQRIQHAGIVEDGQHRMLPK